MAGKEWGKFYGKGSLLRYILVLLIY